MQTFFYRKYSYFSGDTKTESRKIWLTVCSLPGFPGGTILKNPPASVRDAGDYSSIPGLGRSPEGGNGNTLQYSRLGNPMNRGAWWATVTVLQSRTRLSTHVAAVVCQCLHFSTKELNIFFEASLQLGESTEPVCCCFICSSVGLEQSRADLQKLVG